MNTTKQYESEIYNLLIDILKSNNYIYLKEYKLIFKKLCNRDKEIEYIFNNTIKQLKDNNKNTILSNDINICLKYASLLPNNLETIVKFATPSDKEYIIGNKINARKMCNKNDSIYYVSAEHVCYWWLYMLTHH
jgi:hypothetical protein